MNEKLKQLGRDSLIYGIGGILARSLAFFMLPIYTRLFTPAEYGHIEMLNVLAGLMSTLVVMGLDSAQSFYFFERKPEGEQAQREVVTGVFQWQLAWGGLVVVAGTALAPVLNHEFFRGQLTWEDFAVAFAGMLCYQMMNQAAEVLRLLYRPWQYITVTLASSVVSSACALIFVMDFQGGILGFFLGYLVGAVLAMLIGWLSIRRFLDWTGWHWKYWPALLTFGAPLVPASLVSWVTNSADRWFLVHYYSADALGVYAVGARFALLIALATEVFRKAWWPMAMEAMHQEDGPALFRLIARLYLGLGMAGVVALTAISPWLVAVFSGPKFYGAYPVVGALAFSAVFYGFLLIAGAGIWKARQNWWTTLALAAGAGLNVALNFLLVPPLGGLGAAIGTGLGMLASNVILLVVGERLWAVGFPLWTLAGQIGVAVLTAGGILALYGGSASPWPVLPLVAGAWGALALLTVGRHGANMAAFFQRVATR